jgi:hypothetical protein
MTKNRKGRCGTTSSHICLMSCGQVQNTASPGPSRLPRRRLRHDGGSSSKGSGRGSIHQRFSKGRRAMATQRLSRKSRLHVTRSKRPPQRLPPRNGCARQRPGRKRHGSQERKDREALHRTNFSVSLSHPPLQCHHLTIVLSRSIFYSEGSRGCSCRNSLGRTLWKTGDRINCR